MTRAAIISLALVAYIAGLPACGYRLANSGTGVPESADTIAIDLFGNQTREPGLEVDLQRAIEEEFRRRGTLRVTREPDADLVMRGTVRQLQNAPVAFTGADEAVTFQSRMTVSVRLIEPTTGQVLVKASSIQERTDFGAVAGVVVASSPRFQQEPRNAKDLAHMTNVILTEGQRADARERLVEQIAKEVYILTMEGF
jgi:outer membrane lipopolysaccharide assembly protein LptE/RlpB